MSLKYTCNKCGYETNRKWSLEDHYSRVSACKKRLKRLSNKTICQNVNENGHFVNAGCQNVNVDVNAGCQNVNVTIDHPNKCNKCNKILSSKRNLDRHLKNCSGMNPLQCSFCKVYFTTRQGKYQHIKNVKCELVLTEEQQRIKDLEKQSRELKQQLEEEKQKRKHAEDSKSTINNYITNNNTNNYFDHSINYNNYDNLSLEHITKEDIKRLFDNCRMKYPELSEDLTRMILSPKENQCIYLPEGQKSNTCAVMKDGIEMRKPLIRVLMDLGVQTAMLIKNSNVIERNKKDIVNNQFWADNRNACGLNISDIDYMTDTDKEIVQRNKNIVLDMCDGKIN
tara:strand:+ start:149 stop:1165 length:1017 start_codon:yes stop_codon:yes gene_type:complete